MIRQKEFPNLFKDPVVKNQRMSKFNEENDYDSDVECIEKNKQTMLKDLFAGIAQNVKGDPIKNIENLMEPANEVDVASL